MTSLSDLIVRLDRDIANLEKGFKAAERALTRGQRSGMRTLKLLAADVRRRAGLPVSEWQIEWPDNKVSFCTLCDECAGATRRLSGAEMWMIEPRTTRSHGLICADCGVYGWPNNEP